MRIVNCLNTTIEDIKAKKFNIWVGISLGNKYFTEKKNIKEFVSWALENSATGVVILIPDKIHAVNYEVRSGYKKERAERAVQRKSAQTRKMIEEVVSTFEENEQNRIAVLTWEDIENDPDYQNRKSVLYRGFGNNPEFRARIIDVTKESVNPNVLKLENSDYEKLAAYPLDELPVLVAGFQYNGRTYNLIPYPGISKIDYLTVNLQNGTSFSEISRELNIQEKVAIVEAYAE